MNIAITYEDGTTETIAVDVEGSIVSKGGVWHPGYVVENPSRCYFKADFFQISLNEGHERGGRIESDDEDPSFESFQWALEGDEADLCRTKLAIWLDVLGHEYDPMEELPATMDSELARRFRWDMECWDRWLNEPKVELRKIVEQRASNPTP